MVNRLDQFHKLCVTARYLPAIFFHNGFIIDNAIQVRRTGQVVQPSVWLDAGFQRSQIEVIDKFLSGQIIKVVLRFACQLLNDTAKNKVTGSTLPQVSFQKGG